MTDQLICVGAIAGAFGTTGEVRLKSFCADPADIGDYGPLSSEDGTQTFDLTVGRVVKGGFAARIKGVRYRDQADALKGIRLYVSRDVLPGLPDDEFYVSDLIGLTVFDTGGAKIGRVKAVQDFGAGDILEVSRPGESDVMLPFTNDAIPTVDISGGRLIADPPDGAF
ncbi:MAG: ribosome maturation factor RimM [Pseudomonadota bacterium]